MQNSIPPPSLQDDSVPAPTPYFGSQRESGDTGVVPNEARLDILPEHFRPPAVLKYENEVRVADARREAGLTNDQQVQLEKAKKEKASDTSDLTEKRKTRGCIDGPGLNLTCYAGAATWRYYKDTNPFFIYSDSACSGPNKCTCGDALQGSLCNGCGFQDQWDVTRCFSNSTCTTACTPVPQFPGLWKNLGWFLGPVVLLLLQWRSRRISGGLARVPKFME